MSQISVVIAARERASRTACVRILQPEKNIGVVAEASSSLEAVIAVATLIPRILLLDVGLSRRNGVALIPVLRQRSPRSKVILLVQRSSEAQILAALSRGAQGYLEMRVLPAFLAKAVRAVDAGEAWVPRKMVAKVVDRLARLTSQEATRRRAVKVRSIRSSKSTRLRIVKTA